MQFVVFWQCMLLTAYPLAAAPLAVPVLAPVFHAVQHSGKAVTQSAARA